MQTLPKLSFQISITQKMHAIILRNLQYTHYTSTCFALFIGYEKTFFLYVVVCRENFDNQVLIRIYTPLLQIDKYGSRSGNLWIGADSHISFKAPDGRVDIPHATYLLLRYLHIHILQTQVSTLCSIIKQLVVYCQLVLYCKHKIVP